MPRRSPDVAIRLATVAACLSIALLQGQAAQAQTQAAVADGGPWIMTSANGPSGEMIIFPDGSGRMKARGMSLAMTWTMQGDRLCITARLRGTQCADLVETANGFRAERDGQPVFTLSR